MTKHSIQIDGDGKVKDFELLVVSHVEKGIHVAYLPALDLCTHGDDADDAVKAAGWAAKVFIEELVEMGTIEEVLLELGWSKIQSPSENEFPYKPPFFTSTKVSLPCHA